MKQGFSLVELSIVLVILGLLTGGILAGQNLIRASELRAVTTEYNRWNAAVNTFRDKYFALPGDFRDATKFWGTDPDGCNTHTVYVAKKETCDGTGDGNVTGYETYRFWQQLANAGLIEGSYTGVTGPTANDHSIIGENVPRSRLGNAGWSIWLNLVNTTFAQSESNWFERTYGSWPLVFGGYAANNETQAAVLKPEEAWNIDTKVDDGKAGTGKVLAFENYDNACHNQTAGNTPAATAEYLLTNSNVACNLIFDQ